LRERLENDPEAVQRQFGAAEKARDAAIATLERAATRGSTPNRAR
jgi:hypothetical protein